MKFRSGWMVPALLLVACAAPALSAQTKLPTPVKAVASNSPSYRPVAKVNGIVLTERDLARTIAAIFPYAEQHGGLPKSMAPEMVKGALDMVIFDELVYQEALRRKMQIPTAKLDTEMAKLRRGFSTPAEYREFLRTEAEGSATVAREKIRRSLLISAFLKKEVDARAVVATAEATAYYIRNPQQFEIKESVRIQTISIIPPQGASPQVLQQARSAAEKAWKQAKATKTYREFGLLAEKVSDDDWRVNMGDRKESEVEKLPPPIVEAVRRMKPGEVSELFQFGPNFTFFRLNGRTVAGSQSFKEVQAKITADLRRAKYERLRGELHKNLRKNATVEIL